MIDHARAIAWLEQYFSTPDPHAPAVWEALEALCTRDGCPAFRFPLGAHVCYGGQEWCVIERTYTERKGDGTRANWCAYGLVDLAAPVGLTEPMLVIAEELLEEIRGS